MQGGCQKEGDPYENDAPFEDGPEIKTALKSYWRRNIRLMLLLLVIWDGVGLGCGVLFADTLNSIKIGGYPLGFWFAQQGAVIAFVGLIFTYCLGI